MSNPRVYSYIQMVWQEISNIDDVVTEKDGERCCLTVANHAPLDKIWCEYNKQNRLWTQEYTLTFKTEVLLKNEEADGQITLVYRKGKIQWGVRGKCASLAGYLEDSQLLNNKLEELLDMGGKVVIKITKKLAVINITAIPGTIIKMIIPPATHLVKPDKKELIVIMQILQLIIAACSYDSRE